MAQAADLIMVDGSSFLYRAYFAAKTGFSTKSGFPTGAIFIITRMLRNLVHDYPNHKILVTFDAHGRSFRHDMYSKYKSNRPPMPEDLVVQVPTIHHIVAAMGFPVICLPGVEADDVLGSYAKAASAQGLKVLICTGDKDLAQLVDEHVSLKDTMKDILYTREEVIKKYGVPPELIIDYLALKGDASDNIPGMKGVGEVTTLYLLNNIGGIYTIKDNLSKVLELNFRGKGTFGKRFLEQWPMIELSYRLATIKCDVPLPIPINDLHIPRDNSDILIALFEHLEFHRFAAEQRAKKAAFSDLLADIHDPKGNLSPAMQPQIIGLKLTPLVFTVPKGENVGDGEIADPNDHSQSDNVAQSSMAEGTEGAAISEGAAVSEGRTAGTTTSTNTTSSIAHGAASGTSAADSVGSEVSGSVVKSASSTEAALEGVESDAGTVDAPTTFGAEAKRAMGDEKVSTSSKLNHWLGLTPTQAVTDDTSDVSAASDKGNEVSKEANADSSNESDAPMGRRTGRPALGSNIDPNDMLGGSLLRQIESATDPNVLEQILFAREAEEVKPKRTAKDADAGATHKVKSQEVEAVKASALGNEAEYDEMASDAQLEEELENSGQVFRSDVEHDDLLAILKNRKPNDNVERFIKSFHLVLTLDELKAVVDKLQQCERFAFSTACTSSHPVTCELVGISVTLSEEESYYIPLRHSYVGAPAQIAVAEAFDLLRPIFNSETITKVAHDLKQHRLKLHFAGLDMSGPMFDTMLLCHLLDSSQTIDLDNLADRYNHYNSLRYESTFEYWTPCASLGVEEAMQKECERSLMPLRLMLAALLELDERYAKNRGQEFMQFEMQVLEVLYEMEKTGALVDDKILKQISKEFKQELSNVQEQIYDEAGETFRLTSPRILGLTLFEKMKIPYPKKTTKVDKNGHRSYSTSEEILSELTQYPIANLILNYRGLGKLISTYADKLPLLITQKTGRIHTNFNLAGTITGRLSSSEPNLQNIPARTENGMRIREAFIAKDGYSIVSADYSQIELRIIAHLSQDASLKSAFMKGQDIHLVTASEVLGKPIEDVTETERSHAKSTNYGLMYGMSFKGLARQTGMDSADAKEYITNYFKKYPNIKEYLEKIKLYATKYGYVTSLSGRKIYIKGIKSTGLAYRQACRAAINAPMQGGAADIIKHAMVDVYAYIKTLEPGSVYLTLQEHDELVFEVKNTILEEFCTQLKQLMINAYKIDVPLEVDIAVGPSWGLAQEISQSWS